MPIQCVGFPRGLDFSGEIKSKLVGGEMEKWVTSKRVAKLDWIFLVLFGNSLIN